MLTWQRTGPAYLIPGTSLKGVLRSRIEYILRSVGLPACPDQQCGTCLPCRCFGHGGGNDEQTPSVGLRAPVRVASATVTQPHQRQTTHVSIDRFTAGAAQRTTRQAKVRTSTRRGGLLFTYAGLDAGALALDLDITALDASDRDLLAALVRLAVTDLDDALIGLGHATTRGYGTLRLDPNAPPAGLPALSAAQQTLRTAVERAATDHASTTHEDAMMGAQSVNSTDATTSVQGLEEQRA